ncbi:MAG: EAL domain-containing response regulator [Ilumatobacteraceae bacterium]
MTDVSTPRPRLLVIDDDPAICEMLSVIAGSLGYDTATASTLAEIDRRTAEHHDLILLDLSLGETDGMTVMRTLADRQAGANLVLLTGADQAVINGARKVAELSGFNVVAACAKSANITQIEDVLRERSTIVDSGTGGRRLVDDGADERSRLTAAAIEALDQDLLHLVYQPIMDIESGEVVGAEALVRLDHPALAGVSPELFVPAIEDAGRSGQLLEGVLRCAARDRARVAALAALPTVSINVSVRDLADLGLPEKAAEILGSAAEPTRWTLEITETAEVDRLADALDVLIRLRLKGFGLAMDDFGSGTSTLARLREYPFTILKADRRFADADQNDLERTANMFRAACDLAAAMSLRVVAEGIETVDELSVCKEAGCHLVQGWYVGKPVRPEGFGVLVASWMVKAAGRNW